MPGICIFGAGFHGKVLQFELRGRGVTVDFFCDNDTKKHGASINDTPCVSLAELGRRKHGMLVIVAADDSAGMMTQLERAGITRVASKTEFDALFLECPPNPGAGEYA